MKKRILVDASESAAFEAFLRTEDIQVDLTTSGNCEVQVQMCDSRKEGSMTKIYIAGWIGCETARALAKKLDISLMQMGKMLNYLNVKIRHCSLGCFQ